MSSNQDISIKSKTGFRSILRLYFSKTTETGKTHSFFMGIILPIVLTIFIFVSIFVFKVDILQMLLQINDISIVVIPTLLGFTLAAYTIFISFGGIDFHKEIVTYEKGDLSLYQKTNAIFAICILVESSALLLSVLIKIVAFMNINVSENIATITNYSILFSLTLLLLYSIISLYHLTINVFNTTQIYHVFVFNLKLKDRIAQTKNTKQDNKNPKA